MSPHIFEEPLPGIYRLITLISVCLTYFLSLVFLFIKTPKKSSLQGYRISKYIMAIAYMLVAVFNTAELLIIHLYTYERFVLLNTVVVSSLQVFLLSAILIMLINTQYFNFRNFLYELLPSIVLGIIAYLLLFSNHFVAFNYVLGFYIAYFISQCIRYSIRFFKEKANTVRKIDNFFSAESNSRKLVWITKTFIALMFMAVFAALSCTIPKVFMIPFSVMYLLFYLYLGIKHLNYIYYFNDYEIVLTQPAETIDLTAQSNSHSLSWEHLENAILNWEETRCYTEPGLTIEQVATQLSTNRTYLSNYVNQIKQQSFKEWINQLRIEEAKRLLLENPSLYVGEIGMMVGLPDKSNFGRLFIRSTGVSPKTWRKEQGKI